MKTIKLIFVILLAVTIGLPVVSQTVCDVDEFDGPNMVVNGGFEDGDQDFSTEITHSWNTPPNQYEGATGNGYSSPDEYYVGNNPNEILPNGNQFQSAFSGSPHSGDKFLMVDGRCASQAVVWEQDITVEAGYYYFFSVHISTLAPPPNNPAKLKFRINGVLQDTLIDAPSTTDNWIRYDQIWYSNAVSGPITIEIIDVLFGISGSCGASNEDDFGLDDIVFQKGCPPSLPGPDPDLGGDVTLCGTGGTITLDPGIASSPDIEIYWSTGVNDGDYTLDVSTPGSYAVCVDSANTCIRADEIIVTDTFAINLGNDIVLCNPSSATLDAVHSGIGVEYEWTKNGEVLSRDQTLFVSQEGTYKVKVTDNSLPDPSCPEQSDSVKVDVSAGSPDPENQYFCPEGADTSVTLNVVGAGGTYKWYDAASGGSLLASGTSYTTSTLNAPGDYYYFVEDVAITTNTMGPTGEPSGANLFNGGYMTQFDAYQDFTITSVKVNIHSYSGTENITVGVDLHSSSASGVTNSIIASSDLVNVSIGSGKNEVVIPVNNLGVISGDPDSPITYFISLKGNKKGGPVYIYNSTSYPYTTNDAGGSPIVSITSGDKNGSSTTSDYGLFYDIQIETNTSCERTPVLASWNCALPIDLVNFDGERISNNEVELVWQTSHELNNDSFEIYHSNDGQEFDLYAKILGHRNSNELITYRETVYSDHSYFKLVQVDVDGTTTESDVIFISKGSHEYSVHPNPSHTNFEFHLIDESHDYNLMLMNAAGQVIWKKDHIHSTTEFGDELQDGTYLLRVVEGDDVKTVRLIKH